MSASEVTEIVLAFAAVVGLLVATVNILGTFRVSRNTGALTSYREAALAYETRNKAQKEEIDTLTTQLAASNARIESLSARVTMLQDMVTSKALIEALARSVDGNHAALMSKIGEVLAAAGHIGDDVARLSTQAGGTK